MSMTITSHAPLETLGPLILSTEPQFKLERFDRKTTTIEQVVKTLKYDGGVVVRGFLTPEEVRETERMVLPVLESFTYPKPGDTTKRIARLPSVCPGLVEKVLTDDLYLGVADELLSIKHTSWLGDSFIESSATPIVMATTMFAVAPGTRVQELHRDDAIYYNKFDKIRPEEYQVGRDVGISFLIAGRKTTEANGATRFVPGSHLGKHDEQPGPRAAVPVELEAGDAFFMLSSCYRGAGENWTKDEERLVYSIFMQPPHVRQEENLYLAIPLGQIKKFSLPVQRRLSYDLAVPNLGWVDHTSPLKSILGHADGDKRVIPGYKPTKSKGDE
ncbi:hypothetical protein SLS56_005272 [Neofusicoccum ribis]|uniref:Phytanoyl-CoA dioxygenase n=1 Tax=Neofusicoccum ribis TaxID=45134 RepID=A0ABR3SU17_9PEZI